MNLVEYIENALNDDIDIDEMMSTGDGYNYKTPFAFTGENPDKDDHDVIEDEYWETLQEFENKLDELDEKINKTKI